MTSLNKVSKNRYRMAALSKHTTYSFKPPPCSVSCFVYVKVIVKVKSKTRNGYFFVESTAEAAFVDNFNKTCVSTGAKHQHSAVHCGTTNAPWKMFHLQ